MKIVVVLCCFVLVLITLIGGAAAGTSKVEKEEEDTCTTLCLEKDPALKSICKEACKVNDRFKKAWLDAAQCSVKCSKKHGLGASAATKSCEEGCQKKYEAKVVEITASCGKVCSKVETKDTPVIEKCKKMCTPANILKEIEEALIASQKIKEATKQAAAAGGAA